jgi:hypothetical protein
MQIIIDTVTNQAQVVTIVDGVPVFPIKTLDLNGNKLTAPQKVKVQEVLTLIETKAS